MGIDQRYKCNSCGLEAVVRGGKDGGFYVSTETRYCAACETLVDVITGLWHKDNPDVYLTQSQIDEMARLEKTIGRCGICKNQTETRWAFGEPCPRCRGKIEISSGLAVEGE